jgi:hypothetical protein
MGLPNTRLRRALLRVASGRMLGLFILVHPLGNQL